MLCTLLLFKKERLGGGGERESNRNYRTKSIIFWGMTPCSPLSCNGLHGVISHEMILSITTAVKTSNPTKLQIVWDIIFKQL
jgi:hypothetical protein